MTELSLLFQKHPTPETELHHQNLQPLWQLLKLPHQLFSPVQLVQGKKHFFCYVQGCDKLSTSGFLYQALGKSSEA